MFYIKVADLLVQIEHQYPYIKEQCREWICAKPEGQPDIVARASEAEIRKEQEQAEENIPPGLCESICIYRAIAGKLTAFSAFVMHGAVVEMDGQAYVFAAKSGVGKTTHTRLWIRYFEGRARYINGDKPIMRWMDGHLYAYGTPWMGKEKYGCQDRAPVRAFCFLEQAKNNHIQRAEDKEVVDRLFHQVLLPAEPPAVIKFMDMMDSMVRKIPFYILQCNISDEAVQLAYETMNFRQDLGFLFNLIRCSIEESACPEIGWTPDWNRLYKICKRHKIEEMVYSGASKMPRGTQPPREIMDRLFETWQLGVARDAAQSFGLKELSDAFEKEGLFFVPLKGIHMKPFYPSPELRMMADLDILYRKEQEREVDRVLLSAGYEFDHQDGNHRVYFRKPFMNIEMHYLMASYKPHVKEYYENIWQKAVPDEGKTYRCHLSWEQYYIYMIVHLAKHIQSGGSGIRSIADLWLFLKKMENKLEWEYIEKNLEILRLSDFEAHMKNLADIWFDSAGSDEFYDSLTDFIIKSGVYGTVRNGEIRKVISQNVNSDTIGRWKFLTRMKMIFLPYEGMRAQYTYLERFPWLLPAAWIQRILRTCLRRKGQASKVLGSVDSYAENILENKDIFEKLNL